MNAKISVRFVEPICFLLYNLHDSMLKEIKNNGSIESKISSKIGRNFIETNL